MGHQLSALKNPWPRDLPTTPFYLYGETQLKDLVDGFWEILQQHPFPAPLGLHFALKSNNNPHVLSYLRSRGVGADLVSGGELRFALKMGFSPAHMVFSGVAKSDAEIQLALDNKVELINAESAWEVERIQELALRSGQRAQVALRINPDVDAKTHPYISTGLSEHKFGVSLDEAFELYLRFQNSPSIQWHGVSLHIGSQLMELGALQEALAKTLQFAQSLKEKGVTLPVLDAGGGLGVDYKKPLHMPPFSEYGSILSEASQAWHRLQGTKARIFSECGRAIVAQSGWLVTRVIGTKKNGNKEFALVDASMSELLRPALYQAWHPVECWSPEADRRPRKVYDIAGPVCESSDILARDRSLPELKAGDILAIGCAGAYGYVMSSHYNVRSLPAEWWQPLKGAPILSRPSVEPSLGTL